MHNIWLLAKREYLERVRARSFIIMTILIPALMAGLLFGSAMIRGGGKSISRIAIVTPDARFGLDLQAELQGRKQSTFLADVISPPGPDTRDVLDGELKARDLDGYLWVTPATDSSAPPHLQWAPSSNRGVSLKGTLNDAVRAVATREGRANYGNIELDNSRAGKNDDTSSATTSAFGLFFLMYFVILFYGMNVARSIIEEKTSRVFEVLLSTIRPEELMAGKVIGVGSVGLTQVGIWIIAASVLSSLGIVSSEVSIHLTAIEAIFFVIFFLLGYILYSSMAAALGAMTSSEQELQQMNIFLMLPLIACTMVIYKVVTDPDGTLAKAFSFFPFCTPLIMYVRIAVKQPPWYEIAISIAELLIAIWFVLWLASRIYRVGILMYGKRPSFSEVLRWLRYS